MPRLRPETLRGRLIAAALTWVIVGTALGGVALAYAFRESVMRSFDANLQATLYGLIAAVERQSDGTLHLQRFDPDPRYQQVYSGWYWWVLDRGAIRLQSRSLWDLEPQPPRAELNASAVFQDAVDPRGESLRVAAQSVLLPATEASLTFVVTAPAAQLASQIRRFNTLLVISLAALGFGLVAAVVVQIQVGLRPLARVTAAIEAVRTGRVERLERTNTRELDVLIEEINTLIDYNRRIVERARGSAADLAHALKTPLAVLKGHDGEYRDQVQAMERTIGRYLARASTSGPGRSLQTPIATTVDAIVRALNRVHALRGLQVTQAIPVTLTCNMEREDFEELAGNLIENAYKWACSQVRIEAFRDGSRLTLEVQDDGPGMDPERAALATERGRRFDSAVPGTGLGLSIAADIVEVYGGTLRFSRVEPEGGLRVHVELPTAADSAQTPRQADAGVLPSVRQGRHTLE